MNLKINNGASDIIIEFDTVRDTFPFSYRLIDREGHSSFKLLLLIII